MPLTLDRPTIERALAALNARLEAAGVTFDRPYTKNAALGIGLAFFTDPFGTYVELTEGLGAAVK